jgi:hypothetical protein
VDRKPHVSPYLRVAYAGIIASEMAHAESLVSIHLVQQNGEPAIARVSTIWCSSHDWHSGAVMLYYLQFLDAIVCDLSGSPRDYASFSLPSTAASDVLTLANAVRGVYADAVAHNVSEAKFTSALQKMGVSPDVIGTVASTLFSRKDEILVRHRQQLVGSYEGSRLVDFDWSVKHVVASDKLVHLADTLVSLSLRVSGKEVGSEIAAELTPAELDALILKLENAVNATGSK